MIFRGLTKIFFDQSISLLFKIKLSLDAFNPILGTFSPIWNNVFLQLINCLTYCVSLCRIIRCFLLFFLMTIGKQIVVYFSVLTILQSPEGMVATYLFVGSWWNTRTVDCCLVSGSSLVTMLCSDFAVAVSNFLAFSYN